MNSYSTLTSPAVKERFRKHLLQYVQYYMPFSPKMGARLIHPLRYLKLGSSTSSRIQGDLTQDEIDMLEAVVPFQAVDEAPSIMASEIKNTAELMDKEEKPASIIITGTPGSGKTIYSGMLFAELCEKFDYKDDETLLMYSQLKDTDPPMGDGPNPLWRRILSGINFDDFNVNDDIYDFKKNSIPNERTITILVIDSLDEVGPSKGRKTLQQIEKVTKTLIQNKIYPVWLCRDRYYETQGLVDLEEKEIIKRVRIPFLKPKDFDGDNEQQSLWLNQSFATLPLLFTFSTNFSIPRKENRQELQKSLEDEMKRLHSSLSESEITKQSPRRKLPSAIWAQLVSDEKIPVLTDILSRFMLKFLQNRLEARDKPESYEKCEEFLRIVAQRMFEHSQWTGFDFDERTPGECETEEYEEAIQLLIFIGFLSRTRGGVSGEDDGSRGKTSGLRFSHRAFAEFTLWNFTAELDESRKTLAKESNLFSWRGSLIPHGKITENEDDLKTLMVYTGAFLSAIPPLSEETSADAPKNYAQPWLASDRRWTETDYGMPSGSPASGSPASEEETTKSDSDVDDVSVEQFNAIKHYRDKYAAIQIQGFPGTGKTYLGVEVILTKLARQSSKSRALILTLNEALSHDIKQDLLHKHSRSRELAESSHPGAVVERVTPLSLREIFTIWAPDLDTDKLISEEDLKNAFDDVDKGSQHTHLFRFAFTDFHHTIFNKYGEILNLTDYLKKSKFLDDNASGFGSEKDREKLASKWHQKVKALIKRQLSMHKACMILVNRIRLLEGSLVYSEESGFLNILPQISWPPPKMDEEQARDHVTGIISRLEEKLSSAPGNKASSLQLPRFFDMALVDEVQDLPPQAVVLVSFLTKDRTHPHDLIFVGDHAQALNYEDFNWERFFGQAKRLASSLIEEIPPRENKLRFGSHLEHISDLSTGKDAIEKLTENHRNPKEIAESMKAAIWWKPDGYEGKVPTDSVEDIDKMAIINKKAGSVTVIETNSLTEYEKLLKELFEVASENAQISIVVCDQNLSDAITDQMENNDGILSDHQTEFFSTFTIKGLERPKVAILGGWMVSEEGSDRLVFKNNIHRPDRPVLDDYQVDRINRRMLVALSRAQESSLILTPPPGISDGKAQSMFSTQKRNFIQIRIPQSLGVGGSSLGLGAFFEGVAAEGFVKGLYALSEGIEFSQKAKHSPSLRHTHSSWDKSNLELNRRRVGRVISTEMEKARPCTACGANYSERTDNCQECSSRTRTDDGIFLLTELFRILDDTGSLNDSSLLSCLTEGLYEKPLQDGDLEILDPGFMHGPTSRFGTIFSDVRENNLNEFDPTEANSLIRIIQYVQAQTRVNELLGYIDSETRLLDLTTFTSDQRQRLQTAERIIKDSARSSVDKLMKLPSSNFPNEFEGLALILGLSDIIIESVEGYSLSPKEKDAIGKSFEIFNKAHGAGSLRFTNQMKDERTILSGPVKTSVSKPSVRVENLNSILGTVFDLVPAKGGRRRENRQRLRGIDFISLNQLLKNIDFILSLEEEIISHHQKQELRRFRLLSCLPEFNNKELEPSRKTSLPPLLVDYIGNRKAGEQKIDSNTELRLIRLAEEFGNDRELFDELLSNPNHDDFGAGLGMLSLKLRLLFAGIAVDSMADPSEGGNEFAIRVMQGLRSELYKQLMNKENTREYTVIHTGKTDNGWMIDYEETEEWENSESILQLMGSLASHLRATKGQVSRSEQEEMEAWELLLRVVVYVGRALREKPTLPGYSKTKIGTYTRRQRVNACKLVWSVMEREIDSLYSQENKLKHKDMAKLYQLLQATEALSHTPLLKKDRDKWLGEGSKFKEFSLAYPHIPYPGLNKNNTPTMGFISGRPEEIWETVRFDKLQDYLVKNIRARASTAVRAPGRPKIFNGSLAEFWKKPCVSFGFLGIDNLTEYKIIRSFQVRANRGEKYTISATETELVERIITIAMICIYTIGDALNETNKETGKPKKSITLKRIYRQIVLEMPYFSNRVRGKKRSTKKEMKKKLSSLNTELIGKQAVALFPKSEFDDLNSIRVQKWSDYRKGFIVNLLENMGFEIEDGKIFLRDESDNMLLEETPLEYGTELFTNFGWVLRRTRSGEFKITSGLLRIKPRLFRKVPNISMLADPSDQILFTGSYSSCVKHRDQIRRLSTKDLNQFKTLREMLATEGIDIDNELLANESIGETTEATDEELEEN